MIRNFFVISLAGLLALACSNKVDVDAYDCSGVAPAYTVDIKPILDVNCAKSGCHDAASKKAGYDLSNYESAKSGSRNEAFIGSVEHKRGYEQMPRNASKLDNATIKKLACWVKNGSPE